MMCVKASSCGQSRRPGHRWATARNTTSDGWIGDAWQQKRGGRVGSDLQLQLAHMRPGPELAEAEVERHVPVACNLYANSIIQYTHETYHIYHELYITAGGHRTVTILEAPDPSKRPGALLHPPGLLWPGALLHPPGLLAARLGGRQSMGEASRPSRAWTHIRVGAGLTGRGWRVTGWGMCGIRARGVAQAERGREGERDGEH